MVRVEDVYAHYAHARQSGVHIIREPTDYLYGERQYNAEDFAGRHWASHNSSLTWILENGAESNPLNSHVVWLTPERRYWPFGCGSRRFNTLGVERRRSFDLQDVFGFVKEKLSEAQRRKRAGARKGAWGKDGTSCPHLSTQ